MADSRREIYQIKSIAGGQSKSLYDAPANTYLTGVGIDPDLTASSSGLNWRTSGAISPSTYAKFSGTEVTGVPMWIITQPRTGNSFVYANDGKMHSFTDNIAMRTADEASTSLPIAITGGAGGGAAYYNNFNYFATNGATIAYDTQTANFTVGQVLTGGTSGATATIKVDTDSGATGILQTTSPALAFTVGETITDPLGGSAKVTTFRRSSDLAQYGGLDQGASIALTNNVWTGAKFGKTALSNTTYPIVTPLSINIPNHPMHVHGDNALYIGDVLPSTAGATLSGRGCLHRLKTKRTTFDGDTDDGSAYNVFDLPYGYWPTDIESYGTDLVIAAIRCTDEKVNQGRAELFFWDCISDSFYNRVQLPDPLVTALYNKNGSLYVFTGNSQGGSRVSVYSGGRTVETVCFNEEGLSPLAGAVDAYGERMSFGTSITHPTARGVVVSIGSKFSTAGSASASAVHVTSACSASAANPVVTAAKYVEQGPDANSITNNSNPKIIMGWTASGQFGLDKQGTPATMPNVWRSNLIAVGKKFVIKRIIIPLLDPVVTATNMSVTLYVDTGSTSYSLPAIEPTVYSGKRSVIYKEPVIGMVPAFTDFFIEIAWIGLGANTVALPITFELEVYDDQS